VVAIGWSASLSFALLCRVLAGHHFLIILFGLVMTAPCLVAVAAMTAGEILIGGQQITDAPALFAPVAVWAIAVLTAANVIAVVTFHLVEPGNRRAMALQEAGTKEV
jgi:hypothetical protein